MILKAYIKILPVWPMKISPSVSGTTLNASRGCLSYVCDHNLSMLKGTTMRLVGHVARISEERGVNRVLVGKPE